MVLSGRTVLRSEAIPIKIGKLNFTNFFCLVYIAGPIFFLLNELLVFKYE